jgi:hypothetical protein
MSEMMEQEERSGHDDGGSSSYNTRRNKQQQIEHSCRCKYLFNHQIILLYICSEHKRELITLHS